MEKKMVSGIILIQLLIGMSTLAFNVQTVKASGSIYIREDGNVDPPTAPIQRIGDFYMLTDNIYNKSIVVQKNDIVVDGNGYMIQGSGRPGNNIGIKLSIRRNATITGTAISNFVYGILVHNSFNCTFVNNVLTHNTYGIRLYESSYYNVLTNNTAMYNLDGILLEFSRDNTLLNNKAINNSHLGILLDGGTRNTLRNNVMVGNKYNFLVGLFRLEHYIHDVDESNTVDGKPIYYWVNRCNETVPSDAGCVVIVDSSGITVENLRVKNNVFGVNLAYTRDSLVENVTATMTQVGIHLDHSDHNVITKTYAVNNGYGIALLASRYNYLTYNFVMNSNGSGIHLEDTSYNTLIGNNVTNSHGAQWQEFDGAGIMVDDSAYCTLIGNNLTRNDWGIVIGATPSRYNLVIRNHMIANLIGIVLFDARFNTIYHNNFIENAQQQVRTYLDTRATFDCGYPYGGNYWSDYEERYPDAKELDDLGIWDTPYVIDEHNQDNYPLMEPWSPLPRTIDELETKVKELGSEGKIDNQGIVKSLLAKLNVAQKLVDKGKVDKAKAILEDAFIPQVRYLSGIHITPEAADILIKSAEYILSNL